MPNDLILIKPSKAIEKEIWEYRQEYLNFGESNVNGSAGIAYYDIFDQWLEMVLAIEKDRLSRHNVHASTYLAINKKNNRLVGSIQLRHSLTPELEIHGGHIGYGIRPTERGKGFGKQQLQLVLDVARNMSMEKVMITCNKENEPSKMTAKSCGGVLTSESYYKGKMEETYWIDLTK